MKGPDMKSRFILSVVAVLILAAAPLAVGTPLDDYVAACRALHIRRRRIGIKIVNAPALLAHPAARQPADHLFLFNFKTDDCRQLMLKILHQQKIKFSRLWQGTGKAV
jgi:hypothetical protein